jgi:signal peptidase I
MTDVGGAPASAPHPPIEALAPRVAEWAARHRRGRADAATSARRALDGDPEARHQFGEDAVQVLERTNDPIAFLRVALERDAAEITATQIENESLSSTERDGARRANGIARRAVRYAGRAATGIVVVFVVFIAYGTLVDNRWYKVVSIEGGSMAPTIASGDAIVLTRPPDRIEPGMILTLEVEGRIVTHRVVEVRDDGTFVTKGDANQIADDFSGLDVKVVGEYRARIPRVGTILSLAG